MILGIHSIASTIQKYSQYFINHYLLWYAVPNSQNTLNYKCNK